MPEFSVELVVLVVRHLQDAILHPEGVPIIVIQLMPCDLDLPPLKVLAVEEAYPAAFARTVPDLVAN
ncbi:hypothetical protein ES703_101652 [subsurface metagenome]